MPTEPAIVVVPLFNKEASFTSLFEKTAATVDEHSLGLFLKTS
tara:strand:+ start:656 stop:784 length:129 start_codon:yes stop_codon:yes gene_type:complete